MMLDIMELDWLITVVLIWPSTELENGRLEKMMLQCNEMVFSHLIRVIVLRS
jgi:hypothetical protein